MLFWSHSEYKRIVVKVTFRCIRAHLPDQVTMKRYIWLGLLAIVAAQIPPEIQKHFEFEDALSEVQQDRWVWRSEASNLKTLRIVDEIGSSEIRFQICVMPYNTSANVTLHIDDIRYSNDGPSDNVTVRFNNIALAGFQTAERWRSGHEWNVFRNSGPLGPSLNLAPGQYYLQVNVRTDRWGIELDRIRVNAENQDPVSQLFCGSQVLL